MREYLGGMGHLGSTGLSTIRNIIIIAIIPTRLGRTKHPTCSFNIAILVPGRHTGTAMHT